MQDEDSRPPGLPKIPDPPSELISIVDSLTHPDATRIGLTTTPDGDWALLVRLKPGTPVPIEEIEAICNRYPIIYQQDSGGWPVARPAYPALGE